MLPSKFLLCHDLSNVTFLLFIQAKVRTGPKQRQRKNAVRPPQPASSTKTGNLNQSPKKKNKKGIRKAQGWKDNMKSQANERPAKKPKR